MNLVTVTVDLDTHAIVPIEPTFSILNAMASSTAKDDEGTFEPLMDLIGFSGENKTQVVLKQVWKDSVKAAPPYPKDSPEKDLRDFGQSWVVSTFENGIVKTKHIPLLDILVALPAVPPYPASNCKEIFDSSMLGQLLKKGKN